MCYWVGVEGLRSSAEIGPLRGFSGPDGHVMTVDTPVVLRSMGMLSFAEDTDVSPLREASMTIDPAGLTVNCS